jgi:IMP dehydrogenase/GMP reductase
VTRQAEGLSTKLHTYEFPIANLVAELADGLRSGMSYLGCRDMTQLRSAQIDVIQVTNSGLAENRPHALGG